MIKKSALFLALILLTLFGNLIPPAWAVVSSCSAQLDLNSIETNTNTNYNFTLENTSGESIVWIKITRPSSNFTITGASVSGWSSEVTSSEVTATSGELPTSSSLSFSLSVTSGDTSASSEDWIIQVSDDSGGASPTTCTGTLGTEITPGPPAPPTISDVSVSEVTDASVKISWTTDSASNSDIQYGKTDSYGSNASILSESVTTHSITLSNLSSNTTYHYKVLSTNDAGTGESGDNTFVTAKTSSSSTTTSTATATAAPKATTTTTSSQNTDLVKPVITISTDFKKPFEQPPSITGTAKDNKSVSLVEYSIDNGKNWLPVDVFKNNTYEFTPAIFEDGNYQIRIKAQDSSGNTTISEPKTLIIDKLPPQVGAILFSVGPQLITPDIDGQIIALQNLEQKITLSAIGGPTQIDLNSTNQVYSLVKNIENGLWSGTLSFSKPGLYPLITNSQDGAGNTTQKQLAKVRVLKNGTVLDNQNQPIPNANLTIYYLEPTTNQFVVWDGNYFGIQNPQKTDKNGDYQIFLPSGTYYLKIEASTFQTFTSQIFTLTETTPINNDFKLEKAKTLTLGPLVIYLPSFNQSRQQIRLVNYKTNTPEPDSFRHLINHELPFFEISSDQNKFTPTTFKGKPTILTFLSTWSPQTPQQLALLDSETSDEINLYVVMSQENSSKVDIFKKMGGYQLPIIPDTDGVLTKLLEVQNLPTHIFIDRKGQIKDIKVGVLKKEELVSNLIN